MKVAKAKNERPMDKSNKAQPSAMEDYDLLVLESGEGGQARATPLG